MDTVDEDMALKINHHLFEARLPDGSLESIVFTFVDLESLRDEEIGQGHGHGVSETDNRQTLLELRELIHRGGGVELLEGVDDYGYEIPIVIPMNDEERNLEFSKTNIMDTIRQCDKMRDFFRSDFITDSVRLRTLPDLNKYRYTNSNFEKYNANDVMNIKTKWSDLKPKHHAATIPAGVVVPKPKSSRDKILELESGTPVKPKTPQKLPNKFSPIRTKNNTFGNPGIDDAMTQTDSPNANASKVNSVSKGIQVPAKRRSVSPVQCSSTSGTTKQPRKEIMAPPVTRLRTSKSKGDAAIIPATTVMFPKPMTGRDRILELESAQPVKPATPHKLPNKFRPIRTRTNDSSHNEPNPKNTSRKQIFNEEMSTTDSPNANAQKIYSVSKDVHVPAKRRSKSPVYFSSSTSSKHARKEIVAPPVSPIRTSESESENEGEMSIGPMQIYSDEEVSYHSSSNEESTIASLREENNRRLSSDSESNNNSGSEAPNTARGIKLVPARVESRERRNKCMTQREMQTILNFICKEKIFYCLGGNEIWKTIEKRGIIPGRSWHTLRNNFRRSILRKGKLESFVVSEKDYKILCRIRGLAPSMQ